MVQIDGFNVAVTETAVCLEDLFLAARVRPRSSTANYISKKLTRGQGQVTKANGKTWIGFKFAAELFSGFKLSKAVEALASSDPQIAPTNPQIVLNDPQIREPLEPTEPAVLELTPLDSIKEARSAAAAAPSSPTALTIATMADQITIEARCGNLEAAIEVILGLVSQHPKDHSAWFFASSACVDYALDAEYLLISGLRMMLETGKSQYRLPYIINTAETIIQKSNHFKALQLVGEVLANSASLGQDELKILEKLAGDLFKNCTHIYEPEHSQRLESIEKLALNRQLSADQNYHYRSCALELVQEYRTRYAQAETRDEKVYFISRIEATMERFFAELPPKQSRSWSLYARAWGGYAEILHTFKVDPFKIYTLFMQVYEQMPWSARDEIVTEYATMLANCSRVDDALAALERWVEGGITTGPEYTKRVLSAHISILFDHERGTKDFDQAIKPYLLRFHDNGEIWGAFVTLEYRTGAAPRARALAELGLGHVTGPQREYIWQAYLRDRSHLNTAEYESLLVRYFEEFKTTESIKLIAEYLGETYSEDARDLMYHKGEHYQTHGETVSAEPEKASEPLPEPVAAAAAAAVPVVAPAPTPKRRQKKSKGTPKQTPIATPKPALPKPLKVSAARLPKASPAASAKPKKPKTPAQRAARAARERRRLERRASERLEELENPTKAYIPSI